MATTKKTPQARADALLVKARKAEKAAAEIMDVPGAATCPANRSHAAIHRQFARQCRAEAAALLGREG